MKTLGNFSSKFLAGLIALLGFSACGDELLMYGCPHGEYEINGVVFGEDNEKLDGAMVTTSERDTVYTTDGTFKIASSWVPSKSINVKAEAEGYESETKEIKLNHKGGDGNWYEGKAEAVVDFNLDKTK